MKVLFVSTPGIQRRRALTTILRAAEELYPRETIYTVEWSR